MNMQAKVVEVGYSLIQKTIDEWQKEGWHLICGPIPHISEMDMSSGDGRHFQTKFIESTYFLTFEKPKTDEAGKASETGIPAELPLDIKIPKLE